MAQALELEADKPVKIIIGLGNPGERYARNRHNIGFMVLNELALEYKGKWLNYALCDICRLEIARQQVLLAKPLTYMNHSGLAVHRLLSDLNRRVEDLILIADDLNLPFGRLRIRQRGSAGGHRGLASIFNALNTEDILRIRVGIGEEQMPEDKKDFVLSDFPPERYEQLQEVIHRTANAVKSMLRDGVNKTMAIFNARSC